MPDRRPGQVLKEIRESLGLNLHDVERAGGPTHVTTSNIESGVTRLPKAETLRQLAQIYRVPPRMLYDLYGIFTTENEATGDTLVAVREALHRTAEWPSEVQRAVMELLAVTQNMVTQRRILEVAEELQTQDSWLAFGEAGGAPLSYGEAFKLGVRALVTRLFGPPDPPGLDGSQHTQ